MKLHKYTENELREAIKNSASIRQVLLKLGVAAFGGNYQTFKKATKHFEIDISHFTGRGWNKGNHQSKRETKDYLSNKFPISSHKLRLRLLKEGTFKHQCSNCKRKNWMGSPVPLELDHIDGNNKDNNLSNLRLLCPNCHALAPTYRSKNRTDKI